MSGHIAILTGSGRALGRGHLERCQSLKQHIASHGQYTSALYTSYESLLDASESPLLILRDMRDSTVDEIRSLQRIAPVCVIDDFGEGRNEALYTLDLLPHPKATVDVSRRFLFGSSVVSHLEEEEPCIKKEKMWALYTGIPCRHEFIDLLKNAIPDDVSLVSMEGTGVRIFQNDTIRHERRPYLYYLLRASTLITHFGITLFEGSLAGCRLCTVHPGPYHETLAALLDAPDSVSLGYYDNPDLKVLDELKDELLETELIQSEELREMVTSRHEGVYQEILRICDQIRNTASPKD